MESLEWPYVPAGDSSWTKGWDWVGGEWRDRYLTGPLAADHQYVVEIVDSVVASGVSDRLLVSTSMHDLVIAPAQPEPGLQESIVVVSPANYPLLHGHMGLAFHSNQRRWVYCQYRIEDAVEAFWDLVGEKFGITR